MTTPLQSDLVFGPVYLDPQEFLAAQSVFGVKQSLPADRSVILGFLAAASRWVEAKTGRVFVPDQEFDEQHDWDSVSRRITVNNPPVLSITSYQIYTGVSSFATFQTNTLAINNQLNYIELTSLAAAGNLTSMLLTMGLFRPYVRIVYKSMASVKPNIKLATGYLAANLINKAFIDNNFAVGLKKISVGGSTTVERADSAAAGGGELPDIVKTLLANEQEITIC